MEVYGIIGVLKSNSCFYFLWFIRISYWCTWNNMIFLLNMIDWTVFFNLFLKNWTFVIFLEISVSRGSFHYITYNPCSKQHFLPDHSTSIFLTNSTNFSSNEITLSIHLILTHILKERSFPSLLTLWWLNKHNLYSFHHSLMFSYVEKLVK